MAKLRKKHRLNVSFDVDDTIWKVNLEKGGGGRQVPDYDLIQVLRWFAANGDNVYVWSAGGVEYANQIVDKLGLSHIVKGVLPKPPFDGNDPKIDLTFDDSEIGLGTVNCIVYRKHNDGKY